MQDPEPLATVEELQARLSFEMEPSEEREAAGAILDLSDEARTYGRSSWLTPSTTPAAVRNLVLKAAARHMKNYEGYIQSRAGDETIIWTDRRDNAGSAYFTEAEVASLVRMAGGSSITTVPFYAWGNGSAVPGYRDGHGQFIEGDFWVQTESGTLMPWIAKEEMP